MKSLLKASLFWVDAILKNSRAADGLKTLLDSGDLNRLPELVRNQFAHTYDTYISEFSPDFEPTIVTGQTTLLAEKFRAVQYATGRYKAHLPYQRSVPSFNVVRVATTAALDDDKGWFTYATDEQVKQQPGLFGGQREICLPHNFQSYVCTNRFESRTLNGPFLTYATPTAKADVELLRCANLQAQGKFVYRKATSTNSAACASPVRLGYLSPSRSPETVRVVRRCALSSSGQEMLVVDAECPQGLTINGGDEVLGWAP